MPQNVPPEDGLVGMLAQALYTEMCYGRERALADITEALTGATDGRKRLDLDQLRQIGATATGRYNRKERAANYANVSDLYEQRARRVLAALGVDTATPDTIATPAGRISNTKLAASAQLLLVTAALDSEVLRQTYLDDPAKFADFIATSADLAQAVVKRVKPDA